jgi:hypothetical protein
MAANTTSMISRMAALEARLAAVESENELLKMQLPLDAFTAGLKAASPEDLATWAAACTAAAEGLGEAPAKKGKKAAKPAMTAEEKAKKITNPEGPAAWNAFINATWHEMAAEKGVVGEHDDAFKKASAAVGITFAIARAEASRRKAELDGKEPKAPKAKKAAAAAPASPKAESPAASAPASPRAESPVPAAPKTLPAPTAAQIKATLQEDPDAKGMTEEEFDSYATAIREENEGGFGWEAVVVGGKAAWLDASTGNVHSYDGINLLGAWDAAKGVFTAA